MNHAPPRPSALAPRPAIEKRYEVRHAHRPFAVEIHIEGCDCAACEPYRAPESADVPPALGFVEIGWIAIVALVTAHIVASLIWGPTVAWHVLVANLTGQPL